MACNCEGHTHNISMGCCTPVLGPVELYYTKHQVDHLIEGIEASGMTSGAVQSMIDESISGKQDSLSAGTNIQISNNVISATDTIYSAGDGISITNNTISTVTKFECLSEAQWALISGGTLDNNTIYLIH